MKLYTPPPPPYLIRVNIKKQGSQTEFITLCETTQEEAFNYVKRIIEAQNLSPFFKGKVTNIEFREGEGRDNGKSISLSFKGLEPKEVCFLILREIEDCHKKSDVHYMVIEDLDFSVSLRAYNLLKANGVKTIGDIMNYTKQDLLCFVGMGRKTVRDIEDILFEKGLSLKENQIPQSNKK